MPPTFKKDYTTKFIVSSHRILLTGSEGTLGKPLYQELISQGHEVFTCDLMHTANHKHCRADISEYRQLERVFETAKPTVVYNLAAEFGRQNGQEYYEQLWKTNCLGMRNVIDLCIKFNSHLIQASSSEVYGDLADKSDHLHEEITLTQVPRFHNEYALSKWTNEKQIDIAIANNGLKATTLRFFNAYGPGEKYSSYRSVVCLFIYRLLHGLPITVYKDYHRVFMYVDDWAVTVANCVKELGRIKGQVINIGGTEYCSVEELVSKLKAIINTKSKITYLPKEKANITNKRPDITKAQHFLNHHPITTLNQGLPATVEWMEITYMTLEMEELAGICIRPNA